MARAYGLRPVLRNRRPERRLVGPGHLAELGAAPVKLESGHGADAAHLRHVLGLVHVDLHEIHLRHLLRQAREDGRDPPARPAPRRGEVDHHEPLAGRRHGPRPGGQVCKLRYAARPRLVGDRRGERLVEQRLAHVQRLEVVSAQDELSPLLSLLAHEAEAAQERLGDVSGKGRGTRHGHVPPEASQQQRLAASTAEQLLLQRRVGQAQAAVLLLARVGQDVAHDLDRSREGLAMPLKQTDRTRNGGQMRGGLCCGGGGGGGASSGAASGAAEVVLGGSHAG
mmetsp:Transcript_35543/g.114656  ORF Transcript_35543/g.114656 Transcript_35543/m.114656 type:complete len:282 (-) Transcript_35543:410-1255(-)